MIGINHPARRSVLGDQLRRNAQIQPDAEAFVELGETRRALTYAQLNTAANRLARQLLAEGIGRGDVVALIGTNSIELFTAFWGTVKAGAAATTVNPLFTPREMIHQFEHSGAVAVVAGPGMAEKVDALDLPALRVKIGPQWPALPDAPDTEPEVELSDEDVALIPYTSGTTALPKAVEISHRAYTAGSVHAYRIAIGLRPGTRFYYVMPLHTISGLGTQISLLAAGATVVLPGSRPPLEVLVDERITTIAQTPTFYLQISRELVRLPALERCVTYGGTMPRAMFEAFAAAAPDVQWTTLWAQSEIAQMPIYGSFRTPEDIPGQDAAWIGRPSPLLEIRIVGEDGKDVADGEEGELLCRTPALMSGYRGDPERTAAAVRDGWLRTGDMVRRSGVDVFFVDRRNDVIKSGGMNVSSVEVERVLYAHDAVLEAAVVGLTDEYWGQAVTAFVVRRGEVTAETLAAHAKVQLASYKVPKAIHFVEALPKDAQGKILKRELRAGA